jgi:uncharacterized protein YvpB
MKKDIFVSQKDQNYHPECSCGVASMMMLLKAANYKPLPSFKELADQLNLTLLPIYKGYDENDQSFGVYPEDIYKFCFKNDLKFRMYFYEDEWKESLNKSPIMVLMTGNKEKFGLRNSHWVVLIERDKNFFTYLDPWYKEENNEYIQYMSASDFRRYYTGISCQITNA